MNLFHVKQAVAAGMALLTATSIQAGIPYVINSMGELIDLPLQVGDRVELPPKSTPDDTYQVLNPGVLALDGDGVTLEAIAPGASGVEFYANGAAIPTGNSGAIVMPEPDGAGRVFLLVDPVNGAWESRPWLCLTDPEYTGYPKDADDVAMVLFDSQTSRNLELTSEITIGGFYFGQLRNNAVTLTLRRKSDAATGILNFVRTTGEPALLQFAGGAYASKLTTLNFGGSSEAERLTVNVVSGLDVDFGYCHTDSTWFRGQFNAKERYADLNIPGGKQFRFVNANPWDAGNQFATAYFGTNIKISGQGMLWNDSAAALTLSADMDGFTGVFRDSGLGHSGYDRNANMQFVKQATNAVLEVKGFLGSDFTAAKSATFTAWGIGGSGSGGPSPNRVPWKVVSDGGYLMFRQEANTTWGAGSVQTNHIERLVLNKGNTQVSVNAGDANANSPSNTLSVATLANINKATLYVNSTLTYNTGVKAYMRLGGIHGHVIGNTTYGPAGSGVYPIVPWAIARENNSASHNTPLFLAVNENGMVVKNNPLKVRPGLVTNPAANIYSDNNTTIALTTNTTVNSLSLGNNGDGKVLGENKTLTITSGGLILRNANCRIGTSTSGATAGNLVFGGTAYVFSTGGAASLNEIWAKMTAPNGFVLAHYGTLLIGGDQTGINGEIVVNQGTLFLGKDGQKADIDADIRIVGGNAKVQVNVTGTLDNVAVHFDDAHTHAGKLILPDGETETCLKLFTGETKQSMPRGTYGASGSGAQFIDDTHFAGTGVLHVLKDNLVHPTIIILR